MSITSFFLVLIFSIRDRYFHLFRSTSRSLLESMWQPELSSVVNFLYERFQIRTYCLCILRRLLPLSWIPANAYASLFLGLLGLLLLDFLSFFLPSFMPPCRSEFQCVGVRSVISSCPLGWVDIVKR
eukprot:jgi/Botrbrau1/22091/Bobra.0206s0017.1